MHKRTFNKTLQTAAALGLMMITVGCGKNNSKAIRAEVVTSYAELAQTNYAESVEAAKTLNQRIQVFVDAPSTATLETARDAWLAAREPYLQTEVFRFYEGPIDNETNGPEGLLNAWPMDEHFVDYTTDEPDAGLINDTTFEMTAENIEAQNEAGGEKNIATGFHAIEFLLWGQDKIDGSGAGNRPFTDYVVGEGGTAKNQDRRATYLKLLGDLLVTHLEMVHAQWIPDGAYRTAFVEADADESMEKILTGMIVLAGFETGGERLQAALDSGDREDEHSCFSDNTHRDMIQDVQGLANVYNGTYTSQSGTKWEGKGVSHVVADLDEDLDASLKAKIAETLATANALQTPFEAEIKPGNTAGNSRVQALITKLRDTEKSLEEVFEALKYTVPVPE